MTLIMALSVSSCQDDDLNRPYHDGVEGVDTELTLRVNLNEMGAASRAAMKDEYANDVNDLWVGIYSVNGNRIYSNTYGENEIGKPGNHSAVTLPPINAKSGNCYIVAVANVGNNYGISDNATLCGDLNVPAGRGALLQNLLEGADTWEKYKSISHMLLSPSNIDFAENNSLVMSGSYHDNANVTNDPDAWFDGNGNPASVYIEPEKANLSGYIHLRRMISYIKFNITSDKSKILVEPESWRVHNVPVISYLQEQNLNSADISTYFESRNAGEGLAEYKLNHGVSNISYNFSSSDNLTDAVGTGINKSGFSFDFYQMENKQTAIPSQNLAGDDYIGIKQTGDAAYQDREREWKNQDPTLTDKVLNTGVYKSLSASSEASKPGNPGTNTKNFATYVTFRVKLTYWVKRNTVPGTETENDIVSSNEPNATRREGYADYTVHLGYIEGTNRAEDFNCRRNTKYTYNVTIKSVNSIILEATDHGEKQPGAEGDISDINDNRYIELDAHYSVFNIQLSNRERSQLNWMIQAPYAGVVQSLYSGDYRESGEHYASEEKQRQLNDNQFYSWIKFKPTPREDKLRRYHDGGDNKSLLTLEQLADPANYPGTDSNGNPVTDPNSDVQLWYTVFIDEYVYHKDLNGNSTYKDGYEGDWWAYVNQDDRKIWLACDNPALSSDQESLYVNTKYLFSQKSILTYYSSTTKTDNNTALGIERENETFGLNLAWSQTAQELTTTNTTRVDVYGNEIKSANPDNGRYNVWYYLTNKEITDTTSAEDRGWSVMANIDKGKVNGVTCDLIDPFKRPALSNPQLTETNVDGYVTASIYMPKPMKDTPPGIDKKDEKTGQPRTYYMPLPSVEEYYEVITACMSRNRDENGDGKIDAREMKWYVPTTGKYARIILGRAVIPQSQRLMNFDIIPAFGFYNSFANPEESSDNNARFHYASSDYKVVWAEEGTSTSNWYQDWWEKGAWEIRCVRNLGVNMSKVIEEDPVIPAYKKDENDSNIMILAYYQDACKRAATASFLPPHSVQSSTNQPSYKFEIAKNICTPSNTTLPTSSLISMDYRGAISAIENNGDFSTAWYSSCLNNTVCGNYTQEGSNANRGVWRVPNQKELVIMRREGFLDTLNNYTKPTSNKPKYLTCTQEQFDKHDRGMKTKRFFMFFWDQGTINDSAEGGRYVRCVRDVLDN